MALVKKLGVWMDHASAHLIEFSMDSSDTKTMSSRLPTNKRKNPGQK